MAYVIRDLCIGSSGSKIRVYYAVPSKGGVRVCGLTVVLQQEKQGGKEQKILFHNSFVYRFKNEAGSRLPDQRYGM